MNTSKLLALLIGFALLAWLLSGQFQLSGSEQLDEQEEPLVVIPRVRAIRSIAEATAIEIVASGKSQAKRSVKIRAEVSGKVIAMPREKGEVIQTGDLICEISRDDRHEQLAEAKASVQYNQLKNEGVLRLSRQGFQGKVDIASAKANLMKAQAEYKRRQLEVARLRIRAPFDGIVQTRPVNIGDFLQRGNICAEILDPDPMLVVASVTQDELSGLNVGGSATAVFSNGAVVTGRISFISHASDAITRTYRIEVSIDNPSFELRDGLSAQLTLPGSVLMAHKTSPALLSLDDAGVVGVKVVNASSMVEFLAVEIAKDTQEGVWLAGLPNVINLITLGQEMVFPGQEVIAVYDDSDGSINRLSSAR
ncbi:MAG TPA: efflux RND transporter periplasmic adaptor subunit [Gammaproteobacteria bacterium]|nr:efflux RND transporter periplasmic adaptor subunit [Gammaproteobacteria bacterium]HIK71360.1 efflux RND transporter periplasmic adaptor subunit [Pseudomonadales bacterium]